MRGMTKGNRKRGSRQRKSSIKVGTLYQWNGQTRINNKKIKTVSIIIIISSCCIWPLSEMSSISELLLLLMFTPLYNVPLYPFRCNFQTNPDQLSLFLLCVRACVCVRVCVCVCACVCVCVCKQYLISYYL